MINCRCVAIKVGGRMDKKRQALYDEFLYLFGMWEIARQENDKTNEIKYRGLIDDNLRVPIERKDICK
jgi:hypothetical protein